MRINFSRKEVLILLLSIVTSLFCFVQTQAEENNAQAPIIIVKGETIMNVNVGETYVDEGVIAYDFQQGFITQYVTKTGIVDTSTPGVYTIRYSVRDAGFNYAPEMIRTVNVIGEVAEATKPIIKSHSLGALDGDTLKVSFTTDQKTQAVIGYGLDGKYTMFSPPDKTFTKTNHIHTLSNIEAGKKYNYLVYVRDKDGKSSYVKGTFTIPENSEGGDSSKISSPGVNSTLSSGSQKFTWTNGGSANRFYDIHVGSSKGANDYFDLDGRSIYSQTSATATGLPTDGSTLYVKLLWSDDKWLTKKEAHYTFKAHTNSGGSSSGGNSVSGDFILQNDFSDESIGNYSDSDYKKDNNWVDVKWAIWGGRAEIVSKSGDKQMRVTYPKDGYGDKATGGGSISRLGQHDELYFRQTVNFEPGFDFRLGGKLPGLVSAEGIWTGCNVPKNGEGFSMRYMFRENGKAVVYAYYMDQTNRSCGEDMDLGFSFKTGVDYTLTQRIKRNSGDSKNGILQVWLSENGGSQRLLLSRSDIRYGTNGRGKIDSLNISTFHGGNSQRWAPNNTSYALFDDFIVSKTKFSDLP